MNAVEELVQAYKSGGSSAAINKFEQIAKRDKLKSYEAEMLKIGFQRAIGLASKPVSGTLAMTKEERRAKFAKDEVQPIPLSSRR